MDFYQIMSLGVFLYEENFTLCSNLRLKGICVRNVDVYLQYVVLTWQLQKSAFINQLKFNRNGANPSTTQHMFFTSWLYVSPTSLQPSSGCIQDYKKEIIYIKIMAKISQSHTMSFICRNACLYICKKSNCKRKCL